MDPNLEYYIWSGVRLDSDLTIRYEYDWYRNSLKKNLNPNLGSDHNPWFRLDILFSDLDSDLHISHPYSNSLEAVITERFGITKRVKRGFFGT